jgi:hypothetical protein
MSHRALALVTAAALLATSPLATAGGYWASEAFISRFSDGSGWGSGSLRAARDSSDSDQAVGCSITTMPTYSLAYCHVYTTTDSFYCLSTDPRMVETILSLNEASDIGFYASANGTCTQLTAGHASYNLAH